MTIDPNELWDYEHIGAYAKYELTAVKRIVAQPDFPRPIRVLERSKPRWVAGDVMQFFEARKEAA